jgi:uncharacterized Zn-binding protein involved in type VI secretion
MDTHGKDCCPHAATGPAVTGSPNVKVNARPALRAGDSGIHAACCGPNTWIATEGSPSVRINGQPAHRKGDLDMHCGGPGEMIEGSPDVLVG